MSDIAAQNVGRIAQYSAPGRDSFRRTVLNAFLIVGFPTIFWLSLLELANYALSIGISNDTRIFVAGMLAGLLCLIWGTIVVCAGRHRAKQRAIAERDPV